MGRGEFPPGEAGAEQGGARGPAPNRGSTGGFAAVPASGGAAARSRGAERTRVTAGVAAGPPEPGAG